MTMYQLRRLHLDQDPRALLPDDTILLFQTTKIGRNPDLVDVVLISSVHSNMISREHTTIYVRGKRDRYECFIKDHSLNGTYVNDYRVLGETELQQGDVIKFGHVNGAAIKPGTYGPQTSAEFAFLFEEAPANRLGDRRRPITIFGSTRPAQESLAFPSQMFVGDGKNLHAASRLPLGNPSVEYATSWQNQAAAGAAAAAAPFYNLQRFPGYYQAAFPQLNPAYLQSLWPQNAWSPSPAVAHQLQQHKQTAAAMILQQYSQQLNSAWSAQIAADTVSLIGAAGDNRLHTTSSPRIASSMATAQTAAATAAAAAAAAAVSCSQRATIASAAVTAQPSSVSADQNINTQSGQLLQSFAQRASVPLTAAAAASASTAPTTSSIPVTRSSGGGGGVAVAAASQQQPYATGARVVESRRASRLTEYSAAQVIATPSAIDSVKRMECDSSVPSPPKTQQQVAAAAAAAAMFGTVPTNSLVGIRRTAVTATATIPLTSTTATTHASAQVQAQNPGSSLLTAAASLVGERGFSNDRVAASAFSVSTGRSTAAGSNVGATVAVTTATAGTLASATVSRVSLPSPAIQAAASTSAVSEERPMEELQRENAERNSRMSGLEELTEDLLEDCGPPRRAPSPASTSTEMASAVTVEQEPSVKDEIKEEVKKQEPKEKTPTHSPPHQSPKRRGHGHSDSSRSPTRTPITVEQKAEPKRRRKNNEVAALLNDLTEVAWPHLARKSTNRITVPTQTRKVYTNDDDDESSGNESDDSQESARKKQQQKKATKSKTNNSSTKNLTFSKSPDSGTLSGRKRGRPKKGLVSEAVNTVNPGKKKAPTKKKRKKSSSSSSNNSNSSASGSDHEDRREEVKKPLVVPKDQSGTSAAEKIERALDMMRKRRTFPDSDDESSTSSFSSSSSPSPIRRTWGATSQRKTGYAPGTSGAGKKKTGRQSRPVNKVSRKHSRKGTATSSTNISKKKRKKKNRSSSSESESSSESSSVEWEKMKPVVTPLPAANAPLVFDEWAYHDPEKQCEARSGCKKPQSENVDWVQCDYCNRWYHMECVMVNGVTVADDFDCGCREEEASKTS